MIYEFTSELAERLYGGKLERATAYSAGADLRYVGEEPIRITSGEYVVVGLGVRLEGLDHMLVFPRSSLFRKHGVIIPNSVGVIDADYRGEIKAPLFMPPQLGRHETTIEPGERICQLVLFHAIRGDLTRGSVDMDTERGEGGFGSTGAK